MAYSEEDMLNAIKAVESGEMGYKVKMETLRDQVRKR